MKIKHLSLFLLFVFLIPTSCKKKNKNEADPVTTTSNNKLNANTVVMAANDIATVTDSSLIVSKNLTRPKIGDILLSGATSTAPNGFLRKVVSLKESGSQIVLSTEPASLTEAFSEIHIDHTNADLVKTNTLKTNAANPYSVDVSFTNGGFSITGKLVINFNLNAYKVDKTAGSDQVNVSSQVGYNTDGSYLEITNSSDLVSIAEKGILLKKISLPTILIPVPVVILGVPYVLNFPITQDISLKTLPFKISGKAKWKILLSNSGTAGIQLQNGNIQNTSGFSLSADLQALRKSDFTPEVSLDASITVLEPEYQMHPFGYDGFSLYCGIPLKLNFAMHPPSKPDYKLTANVSAEIGMKSKFLVGGTQRDLKATPFSKDFNILEGNWDDEKVTFTSTANLSEARTDLAAAGAGNKILFAGGGNINGASDVVDIYDVNTGKWTVAHLSEARYKLAAAAVGNKIFFAGGGMGTGTTYSKRVDIYDVSTGVWSKAELSVARSHLAAAAAGNKVVFAGGDQGNGYSAVADIYDLTTNTWSTATLSEPRRRLKGAGTGDKIMFAGGGASNSAYQTVDVYNIATNKWTTAQMSEARVYHAAAGIGGQIVFAGGGKSNKADVYDILSNSWSTIALSENKSFLASAFLGSKILFGGGDGVLDMVRTVEVYDVFDHTITTVQLSQARYDMVGAAAGNKILFAGGDTGPNYTTTVDIFTLK